MALIVRLEEKHFEALSAMYGEMIRSVTADLSSPEATVRFRAVDQSLRIVTASARLNAPVIDLAGGSPPMEGEYFLEELLYSRRRADPEVR